MASTKKLLERIARYETTINNMKKRQEQDGVDQTYLIRLFEYAKDKLLEAREKQNGG